MALTRSDETDILASLHAGPLEAVPWQTFLERLRKRLGADHVSLVLRLPGEAMRAWFAGSLPQTAPQRRLIDLFVAEGPLGLGKMRNERVYGLADLLDPADPGRGVVLRDLLVPAGAAQMRILRVTDPGGATAWILPARAGADFGAGTAALLSSLAPHLVIALRTYLWAAEMRREAALSAGIEQRAGLGWIRFDPAGPVLGLSAGARALLGQVPGLRFAPGERLVLPDPGAGRALAQALDVAGSAGQGAALVLSARPRVELRILPASGDEGVPGLLRLGDGSGAEAMVQPLMQLYGLGRSEARLAAHMAVGSSLAEAAAALGLTIATARNYSKSLFGKTGTAGQGCLIRLVLTGVAPLGGD